MATLEEVKTKYTKQYLPGYTGFVPAKNDLFGMTAGESNRLIMKASIGAGSITSPQGSSGFRDTRTFIKNQQPQALVTAQREDVVKFGNLSRTAKNWIAGPNHQIFNQHVPGYTGHVPGIVSENMFAKSYGKNTAQALHGEFARGVDLPKHQKYRSQSQVEYNPLNFRRYSEENPNIKQNRDFLEYNQFIQGKNVVTINAQGRAGWTTHEQGYPTLPDQPNKTQKSASKRFDPYKSGPVALEKNYNKTEQFARLSDGFKQIFCDSSKDKEMSVPIVGYAGHQKGVKARNFYGKSFRESSLVSKRILRQSLN